jgi:hypothetical protein
MATIAQNEKCANAGFLANIHFQTLQNFKKNKRAWNILIGIIH